MNRLTNQNKILRSLLDGAKTTGDLCKILGYIDDEGMPKYNVLAGDLKKLEAKGLIESEKSKVHKYGAWATIYTIKK